MEKILSIAAIIFVGWLLKKLDIVTRDDSQLLSKIVVVVGFPSLIIVTLYNSKLTVGLLKILIPALITPVLIAAVSLLLAKLMRLSPDRTGAFILVSTFGNTGFLGLPLTIKLLGRSHLPQAIFYDTFGTGVLIWVIGLTAAIYFGSKAKGRPFPLYLIIPPFAGLAIGLLLHPFAVPPPLIETLQDISGMVIPLIMLSIGIILADSKLTGEYQAIGVSTLLKLVASPVAALFLARTVSMPPASTEAVLLQASMPAAMLTSVIGVEYDLSMDIITGVIIVTTLLSIVSTPLLLALMP